jgi:sarcosine oxidase subunit gamma
MTELIKTSPLCDAQKTMKALMGVHQGMEVALSFESPKAEQKHKAILGVTDVSCFARFGIKGAKAAEWLAQQGIKTPESLNTWVEGAPGTLVLRLGSSEFLVEDQLIGKACAKLQAFDQTNIQSAYQVARADAAFVLSGSEALNLLSELCVLDLRDSALPSNVVVMTQIAGISATLIRESLSGEQVYRIWCDGTYGGYLWKILIEIAQELGGGAVGLTCRFQ